MALAYATLHTLWLDKGENEKERNRDKRNKEGRIKVNCK